MKVYFLWPSCSPSVCRRLSAPRIGSTAGSLRSRVVPAGVAARCRVGIGAIGSGSVGRGVVSVPVRSQPQFSGGGARWAGAVEAGWREASDSGEATAESAERWHPFSGPGGRSERFFVMQRDAFQMKKKTEIWNIILGKNIHFYTYVQVLKCFQDINQKNQI